MSFSEREATILERVRQDLVAEGFEVVLEPNSMIVPAVLGAYRPDAVAFRADKNLIVEVATPTPQSERRINDLRKLLADQSDWELRLIWASPGTSDRTLQKASASSINSTLGDIENLVLAGQLRPALILAWATLEAVGRALQPKNLGKPQTPSRLLQQLAMSGAILPDEADELRELISKRNRLVHGDLRVDIRRSEIGRLIETVRRLASQLASRQQS